MNEFLHPTGLDVGHADVQEGTGPVGIGWRLQDDLWLVIGRPAADVDNHPAIGQLDEGCLGDPMALHVQPETSRLIRQVLG